MAVVVPAEAVLVHEPGGGERAGADLCFGDTSRLERRGNHDEPLIAHLDELTGGREGGGLPCACGPFDGQEHAGSREGAGDLALRRIEGDTTDGGGRGARRGRLSSPGEESLDQVGLDGEHLPGT